VRLCGMSIDTRVARVSLFIVANVRFVEPRGASLARKPRYASESSAFLKNIRTTDPRAATNEAAGSRDSSAPCGASSLDRSEDSQRMDRDREPRKHQLREHRTRQAAENVGDWRKRERHKW